MVSVLSTILVTAIQYVVFVVETVAILILVRIALRNGRAGDRWFRKVEQSFNRFAGRRGLAVISVGLLTLLVRAALLPVLPPRIPGIGDEFSYVLAGDTFALGRLTNSAHPLWVHFESPHIIQQPTYMSMYFPAQGLFLAVGKLIGGHPWLGVWLSAGLMCSAICWMLQAWLPSRWALVGSLVAVVRLGIFSYWMNSYFGGAIAALGGALVLGAMPRIIRKQRVRDAVLLALGLALLGNSRPYEGFFLALPVACALAFWLFGRNRPPTPASWLRVVLPVFVLVTLAAAASCYYFWRVTGNPFRFPQQVQRDTYAMAPYFMWQSPKPEPAYRHETLRGFYAKAEMDEYLETRSIGGYLESSLRKVKYFWLFYLGPALTLPLLALPWALKDRRIRFLLITGAVLLIALGCNVWAYPHYAAPATALFYAVLIQAMRHLRLWRWRGQAAGLFLARSLPVLCMGMVLVRLAAQPLSSYMPPDMHFTWFDTRPGGVYRAGILAQLHAQGGKHLVLVRWKPGDNPFEQWVYNEPDIDRADVIWAWEMGPPENEALLRYFGGRHVWLLRANTYGPPAFSPLLP